MSSNKLPEALWNCPCGFSCSFCLICWHLIFISALFHQHPTCWLLCLGQGHCLWDVVSGGTQGGEKESWYFAEGGADCIVFTHKASSCGPWTHKKCGSQSNLLKKSYMGIKVRKVFSFWSCQLKLAEFGCLLTCFQGSFDLSITPLCLRSSFTVPQPFSFFLLLLSWREPFKLKWWLITIIAESCWFSTPNSMAAVFRERSSRDHPAPLTCLLKVTFRLKLEAPKEDYPVWDGSSEGWAQQMYGHGISRRSPLSWQQRAESTEGLPGERLPREGKLCSQVLIATILTRAKLGEIMG